MEEKDLVTPDEGMSDDVSFEGDATISENENEPEATEAKPADGEEADVAIKPSWSFGGTVKQTAPQGAEPKRFFGIFGAVIALCLALLIVLLFVGDAGIKIYRTLTHERTVFVKDSAEGTEGLLAPEAAADLIKKSTVTVSVRSETGTGHGTGFVYTADGYICTNHHVVEDAVTVQVILPDGEALDATVVGTNADADLAVLKVNKTGLVPVKLGCSAAALVGESVVAVGTPAKIDYAGTATFGKISATNRIVTLSENNVVIKRMTVLQTDTSVNPGNSGGPLANMYGEVIGIVVMKVTYFGGVSYDGIGFAIPIDGAKVIIDAIIKDGKFTGENPIATGRTLLGVTGRGLLGGYWYSDLTAEKLQESKTEVEGYTYIPFDGVYVTEAENANVKGKLLPGDMVTKINGLNLYSVYDMIDIVNRFGAGETVTLTVQRPVEGDYTNCKEYTMEITLFAETLQ